MAHDVFISYSTEDKLIADAVCAKLEGHRIRCWIAPRDIRPGAAYVQSIIEGIRGSRAMILVLSSGSNTSPHVMREVERGVSRGIPIIPFRIEEVALSESMEYLVGPVHWLDALTPPLEQHLESLSSVIAAILSTSRIGEDSVESNRAPRPEPAPDVQEVRVHEERQAARSAQEDDWQAETEPGARTAETTNAGVGGPENVRGSTVEQSRRIHRGFRGLANTIIGCTFVVLGILMLIEFLVFCSSVWSSGPMSFMYELMISFAILGFMQVAVGIDALWNSAAGTMRTAYCATVVLVWATIFGPWIRFGKCVLPPRTSPGPDATFLSSVAFLIALIYAIIGTCCYWLNRDADRSRNQDGKAEAGMALR